MFSGGVGSLIVPQYVHWVRSWYCQKPRVGQFSRNYRSVSFTSFFIHWIQIINKRIVILSVFNIHPCFNTLLKCKKVKKNCEPFSVSLQLWIYPQLAQTYISNYIWYKVVLLSDSLFLLFKLWKRYFKGSKHK